MVGAARNDLNRRVLMRADLDATLHREVVALLASPRMMTILGKQRTQKALRWFQNLKARYG